MSAQDYSGGDNNSADPRKTAPRSRHRRGASSVSREPQQRGPSTRPPSQQSVHLQPLEPEGPAYQEQELSLPGMLPPPNVSGVEASTIPEDFAWAPQHVRTRSAYAPPSHHRQASSLYQPPAHPHHARDQSASDFYFLQSPHASPSLGQAPFDPVGLGAASTLGPAPPLPLEVHAAAPRPRHSRGRSVSKPSPTRSHRRSRSFASQSGQLPFPPGPGFPGTLIPPRPGPGPGPGPQSSSQIPPSAVLDMAGHLGSHERLNMSGVRTSAPRTEGGSRVDTRSLPVPSGSQAPSQQPHIIGRGPVEPSPVPLIGDMGASFPAYAPESGSPGPPAWEQPAAAAPSHSSDRSSSPERKHRPKRGRHSRRRTRESNVVSHQAPQQYSPSMLTAANPMSDFNYSSQGFQYHGLGIGLRDQATLGPAGSAQQPQLTALMAPPQVSPPGFSGSVPGYTEEEPPPPLPHLQSAALPLQPRYPGRPGGYFESAPAPSSLPLLPPYVSYEQQLQQQREQEQRLQQSHSEHEHEHEQPHQHQHYHHQLLQEQQQQGQWREDDVWQHDYWAPQRYETGPVAGPSTAPYQSMEHLSARAPRLPAWTTDFPYPGTAPVPTQPEHPVEALRSSPEEAPERASTLPTVATASTKGPDTDDLSLDVPGPNYDESARMDWSIEDMEELLRLLEPAEKHKWRYMSDLLTETRKKRIPLRTCQNKFHALFGETESSSKLRSSLFYVAYRSGWDSIRESSTMRERETAAPQPQSDAREDDDEATSQESKNAAQRKRTGSEKDKQQKTTEKRARK